jgi:hypothetical protein
MSPACGSGKRAQRHGEAGPRAVAERPAGGEKQGRGKRRGKKMLTCGPPVSERKGRAMERAHVGRAAERERKERERENELGLDSRASRAHARERKEREVGCGGRSRPKGERGKGRRLGHWALFFSSSFLFLFHTQTIQTILFEFKPYTPNTNKTMRQHECTSKLIL